MRDRHNLILQSYIAWFLVLALAVFILGNIAMIAAVGSIRIQEPVIAVLCFEIVVLVVVISASIYFIVTLLKRR